MDEKPSFELETSKLLLLAQTCINYLQTYRGSTLTCKLTPFIFDIYVEFFQFVENVSTAEISTYEQKLKVDMLKSYLFSEFSDYLESVGWKDNEFYKSINENDRVCLSKAFQRIIELLVGSLSQTNTCGKRANHITQKTQSTTTTATTINSSADLSSRTTYISFVGWDLSDAKLLNTRLFFNDSPTTLYVNFWNTGLTNRSIKIILSHAEKAWPNVSSLDLSKNRLARKGVKLVLNAVLQKTLPNLRKVDIRNNPYSEVPEKLVEINNSIQQIQEQGQCVILHD